jgi:DNA-binding NarL/FixJ family response regulator
MIAVPREGDTAVDALTAGARGIVYKKEPLSDVAKAVAAVGKGLVWAPRHIVVAAWTRTRSRAAHPETAADPNVAGRLSDREREVFRYAATGLGNRELADRLSISEATVKVHLTHIFQKLGVHSRGALAAAYFGIHR